MKKYIWREENINVLKGSIKHFFHNRINNNKKE